MSMRSLAIQTVTNPFRKISVWKKAVSFLGSLHALLKHVNWKPNYKGSYTKEEEATGQWRTKIRLTDLYGNIYWQKTMGTHADKAGSSRSKCPRQHETMEEVLLPQVHHEFLLWVRCNRAAKSRYNTRLAQLLPTHVYSPCVMNWDVLNRMGCDGEIDDMLRIRLHEAESKEEIFTSMAWIRAFNINEPIYTELCHDSRGLRSDEHFNAQKYWLGISREENLGFSRSHTPTIQNPILRVIHKMITYGLCQRITRYDKIQKNDLWLLSMFNARHQNGYANVAWLIAKWMKRKGAGTQKESQICCGKLISKIARKCRVLTEDMVRSLSASIYSMRCRIRSSAEGI
ncbi:hypothetical protein Tco_1531321 [Tanacetum coccineum]